jgi:3-oxoacyl-[acyl-carrier protein] reductase
MRLQDKVSIITGSGRGIGRATALKFAAEGAKTVVCDLDETSVGAVVDEIKGVGGEASGFVVDVTDRSSIDAMVAAVKATYGRIDTLVNNAGIVQDARMVNMTDDQFDKVIEVNLKGTYNCVKSVIDTMLSQQSGVILNASSIVGIYGNFGQTNYAASKFGVIGMAKTWAREFGRNGIRVNAVCPGMVETEIVKGIPEKVMQAIISRVPLGRLGKPEEIANTYAFLASDDASFISGAVIEVSGAGTI